MTELRQFSVVPGALASGATFDHLFSTSHEDMIVRSIRIPADRAGEFDFQVHEDEARTRLVLDHGDCTDPVFFQRYDLPLHADVGKFAFRIMNTGAVTLTFSQVVITAEVVS